MMNQSNGQSLSTTLTRTNVQTKLHQEKHMCEDGPRLAGLKELMRDLRDIRAVGHPEGYCDKLRVHQSSVLTLDLQPFCHFPTHISQDEAFSIRPCHCCYSRINEISSTLQSREKAPKVETILRSGHYLREYWLG